jgi:hypothetical protein
MIVTSWPLLERVNNSLCALLFIEWPYSNSAWPSTWAVAENVSNIEYIPYDRSPHAYAFLRLTRIAEGTTADSSSVESHESQILVRVPIDELGPDKRSL